jgi:predicted dehydrogenase
VILADKHKARPPGLAESRDFNQGHANMSRQKTSLNRGSFNRRDFLKSAATIGAIGAAAIAAPRILQAANRTDVIRLGVIGCGTEAYVLTTSILKCLQAENVTFQAVCDIWPHHRNYLADVLGKYHMKPNRYADYGDMLDREKGKLDAVIVATPDWVHHEHGIACMEAGLDVYCEKEMSNSIENARKMVQASRRTGKLLQIGHQRRSNPRYRTLYDYVVNRKVCGRLTHVSANWNRAKPLTVTGEAEFDLDAATLHRYGYESMRHFRNWRWYRKYSGGPMADLGSHQVDVLNWILGRPPRSVLASGGRDNYPEIEWWDNIIAVYEWDREEGGAKHTVRGNYDLYSTTSNGGYQEVFMGTEGAAAISEDATKGGFRREYSAPIIDWEAEMLEQMAIEAEKRRQLDIAAGKTPPKKEDNCVFADVPRDPTRHFWPIPVPEEPKTEHQPHLENFFRAIRGAEKLNCPAEVGFETAVTVLKVDQAIAAERKLLFRPEEFRVPPAP